MLTENKQFEIKDNRTYWLKLPKVHKNVSKGSKLGIEWPKLLKDQTRNHGKVKWPRAADMAEIA